jgi:S1-C subfamily serine protease
VLDIATLPAVVVPAVIGGATQIGAPVFAVGNQLGLTYSLTAGVVSGLDRSAKVPAEGRRAGSTLQGLIQFDAAVNPGSSGGPLVDSAGHVLGVVTGLANPSSQPYFVGVGFAVPIGSAGGAGEPPY